MRALIVKTSSLGDIIHTLPALTDAAHAFSDIRFDWVAEKGFAEIPSWHAQVERVIPVSWRKWRKNLKASWQSGEMREFYQALRHTTYDQVIDAQGLLKSAVIARMAKGKQYSGLDSHSARERLASLFYQQKHFASWQLHAVTRARQLFAKALGYEVPEGMPDYGIRQHFPVTTQQTPHVIFFHGTTRDDKEWPVPHWIELAKYCTAAGYQVLLPWGNEVEQKRAETIAAASIGTKVLPKTSLQELAILLSQASAVLAVDTGLGHLAAALNVPTVSLYGPTDPSLIGACGQNQLHICAPGEAGKGVLSELTAEKVWENFEKMLGPVRRYAEI
ncbi:MAG: rfaC [Gammaproteobacteria bacterium]|nr:rfaC [Gammaproteobacteria bacterium]